MKKKYQVMILAFGAVAAAGVGGSLAAGSAESPKITKTISEKTLGVTENAKIQTDLKVNPGDIAQLGYSVQNDGGIHSERGSYDIYTRVNVYYGFDDAGDNSFISEDTPVKLNIKTNKETVNLDQYVDSYKDQYRVGDWIIAYFDDEQITMYGAYPLEKGEISDEFLSSIEFDPSIGNEYSGLGFTIDTTVDAVQRDNAGSAIAAEWGVFPEFGADGSITYISETENK
ncbi:hypothetical protein [Agathobacter sp.]